jgi:hypothetical protein
MESTRYNATFRDEQKAIELGELEFGLEYIYMYVKGVGEATDEEGAKAHFAAVLN